MPTKLKHILRKLHPVRITALLNVFLKDETISGKLIVGAAILSLIAVNSPLYDSFVSFWHTNFSLGLGSWNLALDLREWLNEGLMAFFFLVVGLEIKRELVKGELKDRRRAILPIGAAVGGMVLPALIYFAFNRSGLAVQGWGIPIATDIAFAVAILSLLGNRIPSSLKIFLLTLAIVDDIGAIIVIALFYAEIIHYGFLGASILICVALLVFRKYLVDKLTIVVLVGALLWLTTHLSGIHASIVGAVMGLLAPIATSSHKSIAERVERFFLPLSTFFVLPLFAFANAGFVLSTDTFSANTAVVWGIIFGLVVGKSLGILGATWTMTKLGIATMPEGLRWRHILGVGFVAGIGFTVSIFITELAFAGNDALISAAKLAIMLASILAAVLGSITLLIKPIRFERD